MKRQSAGFFALLLSAVSAAACEPAKLEVSDAWTRLAPPGAPVMAGYASVKNAGTEARQIVSARSPDFDRVKMHSMSMDDGVMRMRKLDHLDLPAGESVELAPGGLHLMLFGPKREFAADDKIVLEISTCAEAPGQAVEMVVRAPED